MIRRTVLTELQERATSDAPLTIEVEDEKYVLHGKSEKSFDFIILEDNEMSASIVVDPSKVAALRTLLDIGDFCHPLYRKPAHEVAAQLCESALSTTSLTHENDLYTRVFVGISFSGSASGRTTESAKSKEDRFKRESLFEGCYFSEPIFFASWNEQTDRKPDIVIHHQMWQVFIGQWASR